MIIPFAPVRFKPALNSKGLRLTTDSIISASTMLQASPEFKGIKTSAICASDSGSRFKPALNSKGLRLSAPASARFFPLQASPEFKGIKTRAWRRPCVYPQCFKPALNSKGLRRRKGHPVGDCRALQASPEFKGIKTRFALHLLPKMLQASPEFKGIKTGHCCAFCGGGGASSQP